MVTTAEAVGELVGVAYRLHGGTGDAGSRILRERMKNKECTVDDCGRKHYGHGFCAKHYKRWKKGDDLSRVESKRSIAMAKYFWAKVAMSTDVEACWHWTGRKFPSGYGSASAVVDGVQYHRAHRLAFYFATLIHPRERFVLHRCDNRMCVNPLHLFLGDHLDNMADMGAKGRRAVGETAGHNTLTTADVVEIKTRLLLGRPQNGIARDFNVSTAMINHIAKGRQWKHVEVSI